MAAMAAIKYESVEWRNENQLNDKTIVMKSGENRQA